MGFDEGGFETSRFLEGMHHPEGECRVGPRKRPQMDISTLSGWGSDRVDNDQGAGELGQPVLVDMRSTGRGVSAPDDQAFRILGGARVEAFGTFAKHVTEPDMAGEIAD